MEYSGIQQKAAVARGTCESYNEAEVNSAVARGFALLGGASSFFDKGEKIVLKPNVLAGVAPEYCVTTHPSVFGGVIKVLKECGIQLSYGDSPALYKVLTAMKRAGLHDVAKRYGVPLADFENGRKVTHTKAVSKATFSIVNGVLDTDGIVSICKLKTHGLTRITGAVKNQFGCVPGLIKPRYHAQVPLVYDFSGFMVDINTFLRPRFFIMDAVMAMEGNGPNSGDPKKLGCMLFSTDPVALDAVACRVIDMKPDYVPTCRIGQRAGLGTCTFDSIEIVGDPVEDCIDKTFNVVRRPPLVAKGEGVVRYINNILMPRPVINPSLCTRCGDCIAMCPVEPKALSRTGVKKSEEPPEYNYSLCIRCFCCQETCPEKAISIVTPPMGNILPIIVTIGMVVGYLKSVIRRTIKKIRKLLGI